MSFRTVYILFNVQFRFSLSAHAVRRLLLTGWRFHAGVLYLLKLVLQKPHNVSEKGKFTPNAAQ